MTWRKSNFSSGGWYNGRNVNIKRKVYGGYNVHTQSVFLCK